MERLLREALDAGFLGMSAQQLLFDKLDGDACRSRTLPVDVREGPRDARLAPDPAQPRPCAPGRPGRQPPAHDRHPGTRVDRLAGARTASAQDQPALGGRHQGDPVHHPPDAAAGGRRQPAGRRLPLAAPAGAVRGVRRRHRPGDLRGVRLRRRRAAPAGEGRPRRADARPRLPHPVPQGLREQVRPAGVAPRLLRRRDRRLPRRLGDRQVLRPGRCRARHPGSPRAPGRRLPRPRPRARHGDPVAHHDLQPPARDPEEDGAEPRGADGLLRRRRPPAQHVVLQLRAAAAAPRAHRGAGRAGRS